MESLTFYVLGSQSIPETSETCKLEQNAAPNLFLTSLFAEVQQQIQRIDFGVEQSKGPGAGSLVIYHVDTAGEGDRDN